MRKLSGLMMMILTSYHLYGAPVTLVRDGTPCGAIVIASEKPTHAAQFAALELQNHLKLITGATMPILDDKANVAGIRILVGDSAGTRALGIKAADFRGEEYAIKFVPGAIILIGNDSPVYGKVDYQDHNTFPMIYFQEKSTLWAAYDFLENFCDVRWYAPTDAGITFTPARTLEIVPKDSRRHPAMAAMRYFYAPQIHYEQDKPFPERDSHMLKLRWRLTIRYGLTTHNVYSVWYKYWGKARSLDLATLFVEKRPEYFARNYAGASARHLIAVRKEYPDDTNLPPQICRSNPDVIRHFAEEAVAAYNGEWKAGNRGSFNAVLADCPWYYPIVEDDNEGMCRCAGCEALFKDETDTENKKCLIHYWWINQIAAAAAKINPKVGIATTAGSSRAYPHGLKLEPNVAVMIALGIGNWWHPAVYKRHNDVIMKDWSENEGGKRLLQVWIYMFGMGWDAKTIFKYNDMFPVFYAKKVGKIFKKFVAEGVTGWFGESIDELGYPLWHDQMEAYVAARVCDNPELDTDRMVEEFFPRYYGAAAKPMREFYRIVEEATWNTANYPPEWFQDENNIGPFGKMQNGGAWSGFHPEDVCWGRIGTKERMDQLAACIDAAKKLAVTDLEKQRLGWFDRGVWQPMLRGRAKYEEKEKLSSIPPAEITIPRLGKSDGNPRKVDWAKAVSSGAWKAAGAYPGIPGLDLLMAHDGEFLYFKYCEPGKAAKPAGDDSNLWNNKIKMVFAPKRALPYHQFAVNPAGQTEALFYQNVDGMDLSGKWLANAKVVNECNDQSWIVYLAFPLKDILPDCAAKPGGTFYAHFMRIAPTPPSRIMMSWSPIISRFAPTLERMGKIHLVE